MVCNFFKTTDDSSRLANTKQILGITRLVVKSLQDPRSKILSIFQSAAFFEVPQIRDNFLRVWMEIVYGHLKDGFKSKSGKSKDLKDLLKDACTTSLDIASLESRFVALLQQEQDAQYTVKLDPNPYFNLIAGLGFLPKHYFSISERRKVVLFLALLDWIALSLDEEAYKLKCIALCRSLMNSFTCGTALENSVLVSYRY